MSVSFAVSNNTDPNPDLPCGSAQQCIDHDTINGIVAKLLNEGGLVEGNTGGHHLVDDALALVEHLWTKSV